MANSKGKTITFEECSAKIADIPKNRLKVIDDFVCDRHWENGEYWIGWKPKPSAITGQMSVPALQQWDFVCKSFTFDNVVGANIKRLEGTIIGNEPNFTILSKNNVEIKKTDTVVKESPDDKFYKDIERVLIEWWVQKGIHKICKEFLKRKASFGKVALLIHIPVGYLKENENKKWVLDAETTDFADCLNKIVVELIKYEDFIDTSDPDFGGKFAIIKQEPINNIGRFGVFYVDKDNRTYYRTVLENGKSSDVSFDLAGNNLCIFSGEFTDSLVTESVITLQKALNHAVTGENYALANINYPDTTFINATDFVETDKYGNPTGKKQPVWQRLGVVKFLRGIKFSKNDGEEITTPQIHERSGADPEKFAKVAANRRKDINRQMGFGYTDLISSEYASGKSKDESMDDLDILTLTFETEMNTIGTKIFETVLRLAFNFTQETARIRDFKVNFKVNLSHGKITNEDKNTMQAEVQNGLRSKENYILTAKVNDNPIDEMEKIALEPKPETQTIPKPANTQ